MVELPQGISESAVSVIFYPDITLSEFGIDENPAADLRQKVCCFHRLRRLRYRDIYNDYDAAKAELIEEDEIR